MSHQNYNNNTNINQNNMKVSQEGITSFLPEDFINTVKMFIELDNQIHEGREAMKLLQNKKEKCEVLILEYMKMNKMEDKEFNLTDGKLKYSMSKSTASVNKNVIQEKLELFLKNKDIANKATEYIFQDRQISFTPKLKRTMNRNKKTN